MEELLKQIAEKLGYATPLIYAGMAYKLFGWLDSEVSAQAKAALSRAMKLDAIGGLEALPTKQLADALLEVFDRIYAYPLKSARAFLRSALLTIVVTLVFLYEMSDIVTPVTSRVAFSVIYATLFNIGADYISLFIIRAWLVRAGCRPVFALLVGTLIGVAFVYVVTIVRTAVPLVVELARMSPEEAMSPNAPDFGSSIAISSLYVFPGVVVFAWLPLFALAMLLIRALGPLTRLVALAKWSMKDGEEHPLKAVGLVAALLTLLLAAGWQTVARSAATDGSEAHLSPFTQPRSHRQCIKAIPWEQRKPYDEFDDGYVLTVHKSQGSQWDDVVLFDESFAFQDSRARWLYTGITRAAKRLSVVV